jgi:nitrogen-specific signal transduction histidine kinase/ActR/RegA family two-component response regulator
MQLCQYLSILSNDFKDRYNCIINETIAYDKKMCALLSKNIGIKIDELFHKFNQIHKPDIPDNNSADAIHARREDKFARYQRAIEKNNRALIEDIKDYLNNDEISEILFQTGGDNIKTAVRHNNLSTNFKINISDALNMIDKFGADDKVISFSAKNASYAAIKINYDYEIIDYKKLISIIIIKLKSPASPCELKYIKLAASFFAAADERIIREVENMLNTIKLDLLKKIAMPHEAFKSINDYFNELFATLCSSCGSQYALFICAGELEPSDSVKAYGFSAPHSSLLINRLVPLHSKLIKTISAGFKDRQGFIIDDPRVRLKEIADEILSFDDYKINEALITPLIQDKALKGVIILFTEKNKYFSAESEIIINSVNEYVINLLCNGLTCFKLKKENSDFNSKIEEAVTGEKIKLLAALSTGIAHNFNNLMAVILGRVGLLQRSITDEKALASLKVIETTLKNGEEIIKRLQAFIPKKTSGSGHLLTDINKLIDEVIEITKMRIQAENYLKNITINASAELCKLPELFLNSDEIHEALLNISFNSVEAMPDGGDITFKSYMEDSNICVSIKDTGVGMSKEVQQKAFTPFFTTKGQIGTGLSLSYTYGVILKHQGSVVIKSGVSKGTEIIIKLPVNVENKEIDSHLKNIRKIDYKSKIIVIDDNPVIREALGDIIKVLGHIPVTVSDGLQAFELLKNDDKYDFVFTDYKMPKTSGADIARYVKKNYPHIFIIIVTAYSYSLEEMEVEPGSVDAIIAKPFSISMIENTINAALNKKLSAG